MGNTSGNDATGGSGFSFQNKEETEAKDRSVDKTDGMAIRRRNVGAPSVMDNRQQQTRVDHANRSKPMGGIDPDVLAKEIDDLLADTDEDEDDSDSDDSDSSSDSDSDSDSDDDDDKK